MALHQPILRFHLAESGAASPLSPERRLTTIRTLLENGCAVLRSPANPDGLPEVGDFNQTSPPPPNTLNLSDVAPAPSDISEVRKHVGAADAGNWKPWFPVIDYDRCTNCMQCLSFCLFGVYGVDTEKKLQVQNQDNCKTNCPACSRVCPEAAIMFPKYKSGPINGEIVNDADLQREKMKIDISALLGGDVYSLLRDRSERARSRFSKERDSDKALAERQKCLTKLASLAQDIPPEVLASLPSPEEIQRRAEEAAKKAEAALSNGAIPILDQPSA